MQPGIYRGNKMTPYIKMPRHLILTFSWAAAFLILAMGCEKQEPSMMGDKTVQASICANQLKMFANAKTLWAQQENKTTNDTPQMQDLLPFIRCQTNCPGGGAYTLGNVGEMPKCSIPELQGAFLKKMPPAAPAAPATP